MGTPEGMNGRRNRARGVVVALLVVLLATGAAAADTPRRGGLDAGFGTRGRAVPALPDASATSRFEALVTAAGGRFLDIYVIDPDRNHYFSVIQRREADGALDPSFGDGGSVTVEGFASVVTEDPSGRVVYGGSGSFGRLQPDGAPDSTFRPRYGSASSIAFDAQGRILVVRSNPQGPRYHPHEGELELVRYEPDGRSDPTFGEKGVVYFGPAEEGRGQIALLPDGSILVDGAGLKHFAADGSALPNPEVPPGLLGGQSTMAVFPDGGYAIAVSIYEKAGCTVARYTAGGSLDPGFAQKGVFTDPQLFGCRLATAPGGAMLIRGALEAGGRGPSQLLLLGASGAPTPGFGASGSVTVPAPGGTPPAASVNAEAFAVASDGRVLVANGRDGAAVLIGLGANGTVDPAFGAAGSVVAPASLPAWTSPAAIAAEPDGELILTGITDSGSTERSPFWMRFTADGKLIPTASGAPFASVPAVATELRPAGSKYLYGFVEGKGGIQLAKFDLGGALVKSFGDEGLASMPKRFDASSFVVDPDGGVTVVGTLKRHERRMAAYRLTATGRPAPGFGHRGLATVRFRRAAETQADSAVLRPGGDLVIAGLADERLAVADLGPNGRLRRDFGRGGVLTCSCGGTRPAKTDVASHRGHIYVLDHWKGPGAEGNSLVKVSGAGRLERSFDQRGYRAVQVGSPIKLFARGGHLVVVGQKASSAGPAQVREFTLAGKAASSFFGGGPAFAAGERYATARFPVAMQPDGRIVLAGERRPKNEVDGGRLELLGLADQRSAPVSSGRGG